MLEVSNSGAHNCSPSEAQIEAAEVWDLLERRITPEVAEELEGPADLESVLACNRRRLDLPRRSLLIKRLRSQSEALKARH